MRARSKRSSQKSRSRVGLGLLLVACSLMAALILGAPRASAACLATGQSCGFNTASNDRLCCPGMVCGFGNVCQAGCRINGVLYQGQTKNPGNACQSCQPNVSTTSWSNLAAGTTCNDGNACTTNDACSGGTCAGRTPLNCNDSNVCTTDGCNPASGCTHANNSSPCDDATVCNGHEVCGGGTCNPGTAPNCNDSNVCTTDSCDSVAGCQHLNNTGTCNHGTQICSGGVCQPCAPTCVSPDTCGGGGVPGQCGCTDDGAACAGRDCGTVVGNCGQTFHCGTCSLPRTCGGLGTPNVCDVPADCNNLCLLQVSCPNPGVTTTVTGTVRTPNGTDPLYNAFVYVPNSSVAPFAPGVSCDSCGAQVSGSPLVSAVTGINGTFTLTNVPVGANIPLVIQLGRWRRQVIIPSVPSCVNTPLPATLTRLPRQQSEGDIPLMAFATGSVDALECVMRKIGIVDAEFTAPSGNGRIHLYRGLDDPHGLASGGAGFTGGANEDALWTTQTQLDRYDMVFFPCQAGAAVRSPAVQQNLIDYADAGGRVFATHYSYVWLYNDPPFSGTATWNPVQTDISADPQNGFIRTTFPKGVALAQWLFQIGASTTFGRIPLAVLRHDIDSGGIIPPSQLWMSLNDPVAGPVPMHYTFDTPVGAPAAQQCGRVLFDDFHVENASAHGLNFPAECAAGAMTPQEKLLEFMIFDLSSCIAP